MLSMPHDKRDRRLLYAAALLRAVATGMVGVLLGIHLAELTRSPAATGCVVTAGLAGGAVASLVATVFADRHGRRRTLVELALLGAGGATVVAVTSNLVLVAAAVFVGMLNGMGRDRGAALMLEQAILPGTTPDALRTRAFAVYNVVQDVGHALGGLLAGLPSVLEHVAKAEPATAHRLAFGLYALLMAATALVYGHTSPAIEVADLGRRVKLSRQSKLVVGKISALFALDSLGGGFVTAALLSVFFIERFGVGGGVIGLLFFGRGVANAASHAGAAWLAKRIGLVKTMVFTHIPSSVLLMTVAFAPTFPLAALLFLLREGLVEMDVPTRQSYVMAVVRPEERTVASGVTHLVRLGAGAVTPFFAGLFMQGVSLAMPLVVGSGMKIGYDVALYAAFRNLKPPEESAGG